MGRDRRRLFAFFFNTGGNPDHGEGGSGFVYGSPFASASTFHTAVIVGPAQGITGSRHVNAAAFHTALVQRGLVVEATLFTNTPSFKTAVLTYGNAITGSLFTDGDAFASASVTSIATPITGALFSNANAFHTSVVTRVPINVTGSLFANTPAFYSADLTHLSTLGQFTLNIDSLAASEAAQPIAGSLFVSATASFEVSDVRHGANVTGSKFTNAASFKTAVVTTSLKTITASRYNNVPDTFFASNVVLSGWDGSFPNASTTGVPAGTTLTNSGSMTASTNGQVIDARNITGFLHIQANNVTVRRCKINSNEAYYAVRVFDGFDGFIMEDCEIDANGCVNAIAGWGTFRRLNIHSCDNGINLWGVCTIEDCYIHDMSSNIPETAHYDGIECNGGSGHRIRRCNIINTHNQTSAVMLNNYFGPVHDIVVENCRIIGGGYTLYVDNGFSGGVISATSIIIRNNRVGSGFWGYWAFNGPTSTPTMSGNVDDTTGNPV